MKIDVTRFEAGKLSIACASLFNYWTREAQKGVDDEELKKQFEDTAKMWNDIHLKLRSQIENYDEKHAKEI